MLNSGSSERTYTNPTGTELENQAELDYMNAFNDYYSQSSDTSETGFFDRIKSALGMSETKDKTDNDNTPNEEDNGGMAEMSMDMDFSGTDTQ